MVRDGEPEDREDEVASADGKSSDHRYAAASRRVSSVEGICSSARAIFQAVRARTGLPRRAVANVGREILARRASSDRLHPRSAQATLTASADRTTTNPDRPTITAAGRLICLAFPKGPESGPRRLTSPRLRLDVGATTRAWRQRLQRAGPTEQG